MKKSLLFVAVILLSLNSFGQKSSPQTNSQFSVNLLMPSLDYELSIGTNSTLDFLLGAGFAYHESIDESDYAVFPAFQTQYRYYYNLRKRQEKEKKVSENSGNYITAMAEISSGNPIFGGLTSQADYTIVVGPAWGLQRVYDSGFKLNLNLGVGYGFSDIGESYFSPLIGLQLGWLIAE